MQRKKVSLSFARNMLNHKENGRQVSGVLTDSIAFASVGRGQVGQPFLPLSRSIYWL